MAKVERTVTLAADRAAVWQVIGNFGDLSWHPAGRHTDVQTIAGAPVRTITLPDGATITERQTHSQDFSYSYVNVDGDLPVTDYSASLKVEDAGGGKTRVVWSSTFEPVGVSEQEACTHTGHIYEAGFAALTERF